MCVLKRLSKGSKHLNSFGLIRLSAGLSGPLIFLIAILGSCSNSWTHKYLHSMCRSFPKPRRDATALAADVSVCSLTDIFQPISSAYACTASASARPVTIA